MAKLLDRSTEDEVAELLIEALEDVGFGPEEAIPGLIQAAILLAEQTIDPEQALDEASNQLADSGVM